MTANLSSRLCNRMKIDPGCFFHFFSSRPLFLAAISLTR